MTVDLAVVSGILAAVIVVFGRELLRLRDRVRELELLRERNGLK